MWTSLSDLPGHKRKFNFALSRTSFIVQLPSQFVESEKVADIQDLISDLLSGLLKYQIQDLQFMQAGYSKAPNERENLDTVW